MKRLLALLALLLVGPAMAQEYVNPYANAIPTGNLVPDWSFDGPVGTIPVGWTQDNPPGVGGAIQPGCGGVSNLGQCYQFSFLGANLSTNIDLSQYKTNNFEFYFDFYYRMNCNNSIGGYCQNPDGPKDLFGASIQFFTTNGEAGYFNFIPIGPDYFKPGDPGVNELGYKPVGWYSSQSSEYLFTSAIINFYGQDTGFWGGYYGPALDRVNFHINYLAAPEPSQSVDCTTHPADPSCAIQIYTDPNTIATNLAESVSSTTVTQLASVDTPTPTTNTNTNTTTTSTPVVETVATTTVTPTQTITPVADPVVAATNPVAAPTTEAVYRELTDEEKAAILADAISKNAIEGALAIAADSTSKSLAGNDGQNFGTTTTTVSKNSNSFDLQNSTTTDTTDTSSNIDILETGRQSGIAALNNTLSQTEMSSVESLQQAENIASLSSQESQQFGTESQVANEIKEMNIDNVIEAVNNVLQLVDSNTNSQNSSNPNYTGLNEDEQITIANDPVLASTFNVVTNFANLEILGVIKPVEEKSDAEKRAEEVVAANAKEQEEINNNYMNADQSGLVAAIGADADVSSYRKAMLPDNNLWYRSEDIYKNVSYKDNVRNMYFLEKGNTDTYNKMVEEQYK